MSSEDNKQINGTIGFGRCVTIDPPYFEPRETPETKDANGPEITCTITFAPDDFGTRDELIELARQQANTIRYLESENTALRRYRRNARSSMRNMQRSLKDNRDLANKWCERNVQLQKNYDALFKQNFTLAVDNERLRRELRGELQGLRESIRETWDKTQGVERLSAKPLTVLDWLMLAMVAVAAVVSVVGLFVGVV